MQVLNLIKIIFNCIQNEIDELKLKLDGKIKEIISYQSELESITTSEEYLKK